MLISSLGIYRSGARETSDFQGSVHIL